MNIKTRILVCVFLLQIAGCAFLIWYNNSSTKQALLTIREQQIHATVLDNRHRIDALVRLMEKKVVELGKAGEMLYQVNKTTPLQNSDQVISRYLQSSFQQFPESIGGGLWYEPYSFDAAKKYYGPYAFWNNKKEIEFTWDLNTPEYNYHEQSWYKVALPTNWPRHIKRPQEIYWTPPYIDEAGSMELMMTVETFIYSPEEKIVGLSTVDWSLKEITQFIQHVQLTQLSKILLVDIKSDLILFNGLDSAVKLPHRSTISWLDSITLGLKDPEEVRQIKNIVIDDIRYRFYFSMSETKLLLGVLIPEAELVSEVNVISKESLWNSAFIVLGLIIGMLVLLQVLFKPFDRVRELIQSSLAINEGHTFEVKRIEYQEKNEFTPIVTTLNSVYEEIREFTNQIQQANKEKSTFLSTMSHEIRTPMNAILGYTQILSLDKTLADEHREVIEAINNAGTHLLDLLNDILDISKIESGAMDLYRENIFLDELFRNIDSMFKLRCQQKHLYWSYVCDVPNKTVAFIDRSKLMQIAINLLSNAIKFTDHGQVSFHVSLQDKYIRMEVKDTGFGISKQQQEKLFQPFYQTDAGNSHGGGTGLGLSIVHKLIQLMDGKLEILSELGEGARFLIQVPFVELNSEYPAPAAKLLELADFSSHQIKALVVDDVKMNCDILAKSLKKLGVKSRVAANGVEALDVLLEYQPDILFIDIQMPIMDGYELLQKISELYPELYDRCIAISANVYEQNSTGSDNRFAHYVCKPFQLAELASVINTYLIKEMPTDKE